MRANSSAPRSNTKVRTDRASRAKQAKVLLPNSPGPAPGFLLSCRACCRWRVEIQGRNIPLTRGARRKPFLLRQRGSLSCNRAELPFLRLNSDASVQRLRRRLMCNSGQNWSGMLRRPHGSECAPADRLRQSHWPALRNGAKKEEGACCHAPSSLHSLCMRGSYYRSLVTPSKRESQGLTIMPFTSLRYAAVSTTSENGWIDMTISSMYCCTPS